MPYCYMPLIPEPLDPPEEPLFLILQPKRPLSDEIALEPLGPGPWPIHDNGEPLGIEEICGLLLPNDDWLPRFAAGCRKSENDILIYQVTRWPDRASLWEHISWNEMKSWIESAEADGESL